MPISHRLPSDACSHGMTLAAAILPSMTKIHKKYIQRVLEDMVYLVDFCNESMILDWYLNIFS